MWIAALLFLMTKHFCYRDILCGLLHCSGGNREPLTYGTDKGFSKTTITNKDTAFECKSVHGPTMMDIPHMGLVQDGTRCREHHVCRKNRCVPLPYVPVLNCPATNRTVVCSGHGVSGACVVLLRWLECVCVCMCMFLFVFSCGVSA